MHKRFQLLITVIIVIISVGCSSSVRYTRASSGSYVKPRPKAKKVAVKRQRFKKNNNKHEVLGTASYYGPGFNGKKTANGERFNMNAMTAAHRTLPFNTKVRVYNLGNGKSVVVRVNDRGPYAKNRIIDLSKGAAKKIGMIQSGTANVKLEILN